MDYNLIEAYNDLLDKGINITDLYIYDRLLNNTDGYDDIEALYNKIIESYSNDEDYRDISYHIDKVLNGIEDDEWE